MGEGVESGGEWRRVVESNGVLMKVVEMREKGGKGEKGGDSGE